MLRPVHLVAAVIGMLLATAALAQRGSGIQPWTAKIAARHTIPVAEEVTALAVATDGSVFAVSTRKAIGFFSPETGKITRPPIEAAARAMVFLDEDRLAVVATDTVGIFSLATGELTGRLRAAAPVNTVLAWSPAGILAALGQGDVVTVWRVEKQGTEPIRLRAPEDSGCLALSRDGRWLVAGNNRVLQFWDLSAGRPLRPLPSIGGGGAAVFSPDGAYLAANGKPEGQGFKEITLWDMKEGKPWRNLARAHVNGIDGLGYSYGGKVLISTDRGGNVVLWNALAGVMAERVQTHREITHMAIGANGTTLVTAIRDAGVVVWQFAVAGIGERTGEDTPPATAPVRSRDDDALLAQ